MAEKPTDSFTALPADEADLIARSLTNDRMSVIAAPDGKTYLIHVGKRSRVHLLPYQLTKRGVEAAVAENEPWRGA